MPWGTDAYGTGIYGADGQLGLTLTQDAGIASAEAFGADGKVNFRLFQTAGIASGEAFGAGAVIGTRVIQGVGIPTQEAMGAGAKVNFILLQGLGIASGETFGSGAVIGTNVVQTTGIASAEVFGSGAKVNFIIVGLTGIPSAEAFGTTGEVSVGYIPGWSVTVMTLDGSVVAQVGRFKPPTFQKVLSGKGSGSITLLLDDAIDMNLLDRELMWRIYFEGKWAMSFLSSAVNEERVDPEHNRLVTFAGPGVAEMLEWGTILPAYYPLVYSPTAPWAGQRNWIWADVRAMKVWRDLFNAAKGRGCFPNVQANFSDAADSAGAAWTDSVSMEIEPGGSIYQYLESLAATAGADWQVSPTLGVDVYLNYGAHKESSVRFQVASDQIVFARGRDRATLRNVGFVEGNVASYLTSEPQSYMQEATDASSVATWGRREIYIKSSDAVGIPAMQATAARLVDQGKDERVQIMLQVLPDRPDRKVFTNYDIGDWVGVQSDEPGITGDYRVIAITCQPDEQGVSIIELAMQSLFEYKESRMAKLAANGGGSTYAPPEMQGGGSGGGTLGAILISPPPAAPTGLSLDTGANENVVYIDASWTTVSQSGPDPVIEYEVELSKDGVGTVTAMRTLAAPVRFEPVEAGVDYTVRVRAISRLGRWSDFLGPDTITAGIDATVPVQTTGLSAGAGVRTITATWDDNADLDVVNGQGQYDLQIDTVNTFNSVNLRGKRVGGTIASFADLPMQVPTLYYVRVRAVDTSGNAGPWSAIVSTTTQQAGTNDIANGAVDTLKIADAAITTVKIGDAQITSAKIIELTASKISAGTITAAAITLGSGGVLRAGRALSPFHYVLLDENGLRFYTNGSSQFAGGTLTMELNTSNGNAEFKGTITAATIQSSTVTGTTITGSTFKTAASGTRVELNNGASQMLQYSGFGIEAGPGVISSAGFGGDYLEMYIGSPYRSGNSRAALALRDNGWTGSWNAEIYSRSARINGDAGVMLNTVGGNAISIARDGGWICRWADVGGWTDMKVYNPAYLGGTTDIGIHTTSWQLGFVSSSAELKEDIRPLDAVVPVNPVWAMQPRKFRWKPEKVANAVEENLRNPEGVAGFIVEELAAISADLVTVDKDGKPMSLDRHALLAYAIQGLQELAGRLSAAEGRLGAVEAFPAVATYLNTRRL